jgi:CBS domain-containing protein
MFVKDAMTKEVVAINQNASVLDACNKYRDFKVGSLIVTDDEGDCVGIVTERDIIERTICPHRNPEQTKVKDIMSSKIITVQALDTLERASKIMKENKIKKLPVILNGDLVGIVTVTDISKKLPDLTKKMHDSAPAELSWTD